MKRTDLYTQEEIEIIKLYYPTFHNADLCTMLNRTKDGINAKANEIGIKKKKEWISFNMRKASTIGRILKPERSSHFKKGNKAWNHGRKIEGEWYQKMLKSCFKKGNVPYNFREIGTIREYNGFREIKVGYKKWISYARHIWIEKHGEIPKGYIVLKMDGDPWNDNIENLCLIERGEHAINNRWIRPLPDELKDIQRMIFKIKRLTNEKQNKRPS